MKFSEPWEGQRLSFLLEKAASREAKMWKVYVPKKPSSQDTDVSPAQRDEAVRWLTELHGRLQLYPETLVLAVSILDRFLAPIKARPKYLRCIAIACFFLAAKTCEEDECVPSLRELAGTSSCGCSPSEILRMERIILDKLNWDLHTATPLDFLHIFHAMVLSCRSRFLDAMLGMNRSQHLALLTQRLYHCLADHTLIQLRGSMLALALITLELETCCPDWLALTIDLLRRTQIDSCELIRCRELVARSLSTLRASLPPNTVYIYQPPAPPAPPPRSTLGTTSSATDSSSDWPLHAAAPAQPHTPAGGEGSRPPRVPACGLQPGRLQTLRLRCKASAKRKVEEMEVDDFYDGIKRLYNEDFTAAAIQEGATPALLLGGGGGGAGGGAEVGGGPGVCSVLLSRQEGSTSPCPPLQPVSAS
ncbi:cyclin-I isoform X2 [Myripristis murdjan]|uniref:cyclin-I isoform X2 n=1 Tax=Myripristis murdjan TaxID=586833 RepID=UPI001175CD73|nr:cyclin-I isoform X2 [Myripristis murdjan]